MTHTDDLLIQPLKLRAFTLKNRVLRASLPGWREPSEELQWELKFARDGVAAIISPLVSAMPPDQEPAGLGDLHRPESIHALQELVGRVHAYGCKYLIQLGHPSGPQEERRATESELAERFAEAAQRARETGADGIELWGIGTMPGTAAQRLRHVVRSVRAAVGRDFHVQVNLGPTAGTAALFQALREDGLDAAHVSAGNAFSRPYAAGEVDPVEAANLALARQLKQQLGLPVICSGRFHTADSVRAAIQDGACDAVSMARPLAATSEVLRVPARSARLRPSRIRRALALALDGTTPRPHSS